MSNESICNIFGLILSDEHKNVAKKKAKKKKKFGGPGFELAIYRF